MGLLELIWGLVIVGIVIGIFFVLAKKENEESDKLISTLTEEQINVLKSSEVFSVDGKACAYVCTAMVAKIVDKGNKVAISLLYNDKFRMGATFNKITCASSKITKVEQEKYNLKVGDFVKICIDFDKFDTKIILD